MFLKKLTFVAEDIQILHNTGSLPPQGLHRVPLIVVCVESLAPHFDVLVAGAGFVAEGVRGSCFGEAH